MASSMDPDSAIVVESVGEWSTLLRQTLAECALDVLIAKDGQEAVHIARSITARLILLRLPAFSLIELNTCERIRLLPHYDFVPIILIGARQDVGMRKAAARVGINQLLTLPISILELKQAVLSLLGAAPPDPTMFVEWKRKAEPLPAFGEAPELVQGSRLLQLCRRGSAPNMLRRTNWIR